MSLTASLQFLSGIYNYIIWIFGLLLMTSAFSDGKAETGNILGFPDPPGTQGMTRGTTVEFVIVTNTDLEQEFIRLADWRSDHGTTATVVTLDWITEAVTPGIDLQETIRNFLILAFNEWQTRFVLLGGDAAILPPRYVRSNANDLASDWYFGCLDGNWDADGDGIYGEFSSVGDDPDLEPELGVGRAPVFTAEQTATFVDKVIAHDQSLDLPYLNQALFLGEVIVPDHWQPGDLATMDGGQFLDDLLPIFEGSQPPVQVARLYENFEPFAGADSLCYQATVDSLAIGHFNLVYFMGRGSETTLQLGGFPIPDLLTVLDIPFLTNYPKLFTILALTPTGATALRGEPTLFEEMVRSAEGAAVAAFGSSDVNYLSSNVVFNLALVQNLLASGNVRLGQAHMQVLADLSQSASTNPGFHLALMESVLLGDPAMSFRPSSVTSVQERRQFQPTRAALIKCFPNPFNPQTKIVFEIPELETVSLRVFDMAGRLVRGLITAETHDSGRHEVVWKGRDDNGRQVASGTYFYRLEAGSYSETKRMLLVK